MRFKIYYDEKDKQLDINCLKGTNTDVIIPENVDQHVYYPIPDDLQGEIKVFLRDILNEQISEELEAVQYEMMQLIEKRKEIITKTRQKLNPVIIEKCKEFKVLNAEYFV